MKDINDHIAAIREHLKAIETCKQPEGESKRCLTIAIGEKSIGDVIQNIMDKAQADALSRRLSSLDTAYWMILSELIVNGFRDFLNSAKIITVKG